MLTILIILSLFSIFALYVTWFDVRYNSKLSFGDKVFMTFLFGSLSYLMWTIYLNIHGRA
jgi:hypothetical protein